MKTKTGQLLMRRLQNKSSSPAIIQEQQFELEEPAAAQRQPMRKWQGTHVSHVNEYSFVNIINRREEGPPCREDLKNLQIQNLRLIEENMRLTEWTHNLLNKLRQGLIQAIQAIEQFRYLQGVNLMYSFLGEMTEYDDSKYKLPRRPELIEENQMLKRFAHPHFNKARSPNYSNMQICPAVHSLTVRPSQKQPADLSAMVRHQDPLQNRQIRQNEIWIRMLLGQALTLQSYVDTKDKYP